MEAVIYHNSLVFLIHGVFLADLRNAGEDCVLTVFKIADGQINKFRNFQHFFLPKAAGRNGGSTDAHPAGDGGLSGSAGTAFLFNVM